MFINFPLLCSEWSIRLPDVTFDEILTECWNRFWKVKRLTFNAFKYEWDILLSYTKLLDAVGELFYRDKIKMMKAYFEVNRFVNRISNILPKNAVCLVVSDHGITSLENSKYGKHSDHAFYSCNTSLNPKPNSITDFYKIIEGLKTRNP